MFNIETQYNVGMNKYAIDGVFFELPLVN